MRIAFDGEFEHLPPSGIGGYVRNLIAEMPRVATDLDLAVLYPDWDRSGPAERGLLRDRRIQRASWELFSFAKSARTCHPDLLHIPSFAAPLLPPAPFVVTIHDMIPFLLPEYRASRPMRAHMAIMRERVKRAEMFIAPSQSAAAEIANVLEMDPDRIRVTYEAAESAYRPLSDSSPAKEVLAKFGVRGRYIFNVGGLDIRKNVPQLIEAFALVLSEAAEPLQLVIAGARHSDNPVVFPPLEPVVERFGLQGSVVFTGRISETEKLALYQSAALYVTPSAHEGFGLTALEAMACGVPTIAANRTSFPEVVGDGGLLVEPDPGALAAAMTAVLTNGELATELRNNGLARASTFSWERTAKETVEVYREVLARKRHTR